MFLETKVWIGEHKIILKLEINKNKVEGGRVVKEANFALFFFVSVKFNFMNSHFLKFGKFEVVP